MNGYDRLCLKIVRACMDDCASDTSAYRRIREIMRGGTLKERSAATMLRVMIDHYLREDGGPGSGNYGHAGRPGQVGGSGSGGGGGGSSKSSGGGKKKSSPNNGLKRLEGDDDFTRSTVFGGAISKLRKNKPLNESEKAVVDQADSAMRPMESDMTLYRGSTDDIERGVFTPEEMASWNSWEDVAKSWVGKTFSDKGFMYTSTDREATRDYSSGYELVITAHEGTKAVIGSGEVGTEVILGRDQQFRCTNAHVDENERVVLEVEVEGSGTKSGGDKSPAASTHDGDPVSGNYGHSGRPGQVGGSGGGGGSSSSGGRSSIARKKAKEYMPQKGSIRYHLNQGWNKERTAYLSDMGHSPEDIKRLDDLVTRQIQSAHSADEDMRRFAKEHPDLISEAGAFESEAAEIRLQMEKEQLDKDIEYVKEQREEIRKMDGISDDDREYALEACDQKLEQYKSKKSELDGPIKVYRKGDYNSPMLSFTDDPNGAILHKGIENETQIYPDHEDTLSNLIERGIIPVAGYGAFDNFYGEREITFVNTKA